VQTARLDPNVDETISLIQPLGVTGSCMALDLEPYQYRIETGSRLCRSVTGTSRAVKLNDTGRIVAVAVSFVS
jgi:hypothetical protein